MNLTVYQPSQTRDHPPRVRCEYAQRAVSHDTKPGSIEDRTPHYLVIGAARTRSHWRHTQHASNGLRPSAADHCKRRDTPDFLPSNLLPDGVLHASMRMSRPQCRDTRQGRQTTVPGEGRNVATSTVRRPAESPTGVRVLGDAWVSHRCDLREAEGSKACLVSAGLVLS